MMGFPRGDYLIRMVEDAYNSVHMLSVATHYLSCASGVGRPPAKE